MNRFGTAIAGSKPTAQARGRFVAAAAMAPMLALSVFAGAAPASAQDISDKTVSSFMNYAWGLTPARFTKPDGTTVDIDKNDRTKSEVAIDVAREVIRAGRLTAHAQMCELPSEQVQNYQSLMRREDGKKKWSEQQMIYINQLHLATVMMLTGKIELIEASPDGKPAEVKIAPTPADAKTCTEEQRTKVKELITAYVKTGPEQPKPGDAPAAPAAAPAAAAPAAAAPAAAPVKKP
jgi:hypothetical protein